MLLGSRSGAARSGARRARRTGRGGWRWLVAADRGGGAEAPEHLRHCHLAALILEVLHDRQQRPGGGASAVQRVHELELALTAELDVQPARLVVRRVRARGDLPVTSL